MDAVKAQLPKIEFKHFVGTESKMAAVNVFQNIEDVNQNKITFTLAPTDVAFANTLRRLIVTGVKVVGFRADMNEDGSTTDVQITKNSTPMTNEMLADRIGLLPMTVSNPMAWNPKKYKFVLDVTNTDSRPRDVLASDIQVFRVNEDGKETLVPKNRFFVPDPITRETALIAVLKGKQPGQDPETIQLTAKATAGVGREHARFIPTSQCAYKYTINTDERVQAEKFEQWALNNKKISDKKELEENAEIRKRLLKEFNTMEVDRCYLEKDGVPYSFDFQVESVGTIPVREIVKAGLDAGVRLCVPFTNLNLQARKDEDEAARKARDANFPRITPAPNMVAGFDFTFQRQDHTLGNLLQSYMELYMMDIPDARLTYVGYYIPHPLRDEMILRVGVTTNEERDARDLVSDAARGCMNLFQTWSDQWTRASGASGFAASPEVEEEEASSESPNESASASNASSNSASNSNSSSSNSSSGNNASSVVLSSNTSSSEPTPPPTKTKKATATKSKK
jgi:DNA-directed RNA polymerase subunit D